MPSSHQIGSLLFVTHSRLHYKSKEHLTSGDSVTHVDPNNGLNLIYQGRRDVWSLSPSGALSECSRASEEQTTCIIASSVTLKRYK